MFTHKTPWVILLLLWMGGATWWHVCQIKQLCADTPAIAASPDATAATSAPVAVPTLTIADGEKLRLTVPGNFRYAKSGAATNVTGVGNTLKTLADYLKANPTRPLTVKGYYRADEQNATTYPNLGVARAEDLKAQLVKMGVSASQLSTEGVQLSESETALMPYNAPGDSLYGGLAFIFTGQAPPPETTPARPADTIADTTPKVLPKTEEGLAEAQKFTSVFKPIDLYFKLGESSYIQTKDTREFFEEAEKYLKEHPDKKLILTGHTDNAGPESVNLELSRARAGNVKKRLRKGGIKSDQIAVEAKGETEPKESNDTREGRKANRRVTVVVH